MPTPTPTPTPARPVLVSLLAASLVAAIAAVAGSACGDRGAPQITVTPTVAAPELEKPGAMTVTGSAVLDVSPDCADLTMTLAGEGARPGQATAAVQGQQQALIEALRALGVTGGDLRLSYLRLDPVYAQTPQGVQTQRIIGYHAEVTVSATTRRFELIGAIMEAGANAGASSISSQLRRSDLAELKKQVRELALKAAREKAAQTAKALGIELGRIVTVSEAPGGAMWGSAYFPQVANEAVTRSGGGVLGGALQSLALDVTVSYELAKRA